MFFLMAGQMPVFLPSEKRQQRRQQSDQSVCVRFERVSGEIQEAKGGKGPTESIH